MSRHEFPGRTPDTTVTLGWDRPLQTFFVQVLGTDDYDEDMTLFWRGTDLREITTAAQAVELALPWVELPDGVAIRLETARLKTLGMSDGDAQVAAKRFMED